MSCIYALCDPRTLEIRYIGLTKLTAEERLCGHIKSAVRGSDRYVYKWIRTLSDSPKIMILEENPLDLSNAERYWIKKFRDNGARLCNMTEGGDGLIDPIEDVIKRISKTLTGRKMSAEACYNMKLAWQRRKLSGLPGTRKGILNSDITKQKMSVSHKGIKRPAYIGKRIAASVKNNWANLSSDELLVRRQAISRGIMRKKALTNGTTD